MIRLAKKEDLKEIIILQNKCLPEKYPIELFEKLLSSTFIYEMDNKIIGYAMLANVLIIPSDVKKYINGGKISSLISFGVDNDYRNKGIGYKLLSDILNRLSAEYLMLNVRVSNRANNLYDRLGFIKLKRIENYYKNEDGFLRILKIKE
jgi:ribosomal protein S18 acetylase RimI-like enzyme